MNIKYSIIIPVYNSEKTIDRCLRSILQQSREDVEVIVVDDGSEDDSGKILSTYAETSRRITLISQNNRGVSAARNAGIERASGTYILFVDSDDFVSENYFSILDLLEKQSEDDLLMFASNTVGGLNVDEAKLYYYLENLVEKEKKMELLLSSRKIMSPWNKRFKREIIRKNNIHFIKNLQTGEDFNFCLEYMLECDTICVKYQKIYNVDISDSKSLSRKYRGNLDIQLKKAFKNAAGLIKKSSLDDKEKDNLLKIVDYLFVKNVFTCIAEEFKKTKPCYRKTKRDIVEIYKKFLNPLCRKGTYYNFIHRILRVLVSHKYILPVYWITRFVKEKQFSKYIEE